MSLTMTSSLFEKSNPPLLANPLLSAIERHPPDNCKLCRAIDQPGYMLQDTTGSRKYFCLSCLIALLTTCVEPLPTATVES